MIACGVWLATVVAWLVWLFGVAGMLGVFGVTGWFVLVCFVCEWFAGLLVVGCNGWWLVVGLWVLLLGCCGWLVGWLVGCLVLCLFAV